MATKIRITDTQIMYGQTIMNVLHFNQLEAAFEPEAAANAFLVNWVAMLRPCQKAQLTHVRITVQNMDDPLISAHVTEVSLPGSGGSDERGLTYQALVLKYETGLSGRHYRGRSYLQVGTSDNCHLGFWDPGFLATPVGPFVEFVRLHMTGTDPDSNLQLCVKQGGGIGTFTPVTNVQARNITGMQRRRNIGNGI